jgi:hypothetical protein
LQRCFNIFTHICNVEAFFDYIISYRLATACMGSGVQTTAERPCRRSGHERKPYGRHGPDRRAE